MKNDKIREKIEEEMIEEYEEDQELLRDNKEFERRLWCLRNPLPKPKDRYDRDFEIPRNEYSQYTSCGNFSYGRKEVWGERRLVAQVAELRAEGCEMLPGENLEDFVKRNVKE